MNKMNNRAQIGTTLTWFVAVFIIVASGKFKFPGISLPQSKTVANVTPQPTSKPWFSFNQPTAKPTVKRFD